MASKLKIIDNAVMDILAKATVHAAFNKDQPISSIDSLLRDMSSKKELKDKIMGTLSNNPTERDNLFSKIDRDKHSIKANGDVNFEAISIIEKIIKGHLDEDEDLILSNEDVFTIENYIKGKSGLHEFRAVVTSIADAYRELYSLMNNAMDEFNSKDIPTLLFLVNHKMTKRILGYSHPLPQHFEQCNNHNKNLMLLISKESEESIKDIVDEQNELLFRLQFKAKKPRKFNLGKYRYLGFHLQSDKALEKEVVIQERQKGEIK